MKVSLFILTLLFPISLLAQFSQKYTLFYGIADGISDIKTADFNADGKIDIAVADNDHLSVLIKLDSLDRFELPVSLAEGYHHKIEVADLDYDGDVDILTISPQEQLVWYVNAGDGQFSATQYIDAEVAGISGIAMADFDTDGFVDIVISTGDGASSHRAVYRYRNLQNGNFATRDTLTTFIGNNFYDTVFAADVDGDGLTDVLSSIGFQNSRIVWYKNLGAGVFANEQVLINLGTYNLLAYDFDGDSHTDIVFGTLQDIMFAKNNGDATFQPYYSIYNKQLLHDLTAADTDLDGDMDIYATYDGTSAPYILRMMNNGDGTYATNSVPTDDNPMRALFIGEINGDSLPDLFAATKFDELFYYVNPGAGNYFNHEDAGHVYYPEGMAIGDIDADGDEDIILGSEGAAFTASYINQGGGSFRFGQKIHESLSTQLMLFDFNGDGYQDVLKSQNYLAFPYTQVQIHFNNAAGGFNQVVGMPASGGFTSYGHPYDVNADGLTDLIFCRRSDNRGVHWRKNLGNNTFGTGGQLLNMGDANPLFAQPHDIDGDGDDDLVVVYIYGNQNINPHIYWYENTGPNAYTAHLIDQNQGNFNDIEICDIDDDGTLDILVVSSVVTLYRNDGFGVFSEELPAFDLANAPMNLLPGDFDFDGDLDLAASSFWNQYVVWLENIDGTGTQFTTHWLDDDLDGADDMAFFDINNDDKKDLVVAAKGEVAFYSNMHPVPPALSVADVTAVCFDNGTPADSLDDQTVLSFVVVEGALSELGDTALITINETTYLSPFGAVFMLSLPNQSLNGEPVSVRVAGLEIDSVFIEFAIDNPGTCSGAVPSITAAVLSVTCQDNQTAALPADDFLIIDVLVQQEFLSDTFVVSSPEIAFTPVSGPYGETVAIILPPGSATQGDFVLQFEDSQHPGFSTSGQVVNPGSCSVVGAENPAFENISVLISPNPFHEKVTLTVSGLAPQANYRLSVYDGLGRNVLNSPVSEGSCIVDMNNLTGAIYFFQIINNQTGVAVKSGSIVKA